MAITINVVLDTDMGAEIGARFFNRASPASQVGADVVLDQNGTRTLLYEEPGLSDITVNTVYDVDLYRTDGAATLTTLFSAAECYIGADGGVYWISDVTDPAAVADSVLDELLSEHTTAGSLGKALADVETYTDILDDSNTGLLAIADTAGHSLNILVGTLANAGQATETYNLTAWKGANYRCVFAGLDGVGNRTGQTLSNP